MQGASAAAGENPRALAALTRNDRYLSEFVEAFNLCPYARRCRETGRLHRTVRFETGGAPGSTDFDAAVAILDDAIAYFEKLPAGEIEVGLVLFPALCAGLAHGPDAARAFEQLVAAARRRVQGRHAGGDTPFYCVPFHPDFAEDLDDAHRAVRFIRRSPDPTVQLVRASALRAVRGCNPGVSDYVATAGLSATQLMALATPLSVQDRIAQANLKTLLDAGPERLRGLLAEISAQDRDAGS